MVIGGDCWRLSPTLILLTRTIHDDSSQNQPDPRGDGQAECWEADAFLKQQGEATKGGLARKPCAAHGWACRRSVLVVAVEGSMTRSSSFE